MSLTGKRVRLPANENAFIILGIVKNIVRKEFGKSASDEYLKEATSGDYQNLLEVTRRYVTLDEYIPLPTVSDEEDEYGSDD